MVWAPIWLPKPCRRPSRRHLKKNLNFETYLLLIFDCFGATLEHPKSQKNVRTHLGAGPILASKAAWKENEAPRCYFRAFWLPKLVFRGRFLSIFCIFLGSRSSNSIRHRLQIKIVGATAITSAVGGVIGIARLPGTCQELVRNLPEQ